MVRASTQSSSRSIRTRPIRKVIASEASKKNSRSTKPILIIKGLDVKMSLTGVPHPVEWIESMVEAQLQSIRSIQVGQKGCKARSYRVLRACLLVLTRSSTIVQPSSMKILTSRSSQCGSQKALTREIFIMATKYLRTLKLPPSQQCLEATLLEHLKTKTIHREPMTKRWCASRCPNKFHLSMAKRKAMIR